MARIRSRLGVKRARGTDQAPAQPAGSPKLQKAEPIAPNPAAGWYQDPSNPGAARYWDGHAWTNRTGPLAAPGKPPAQSDGPPASDGTRAKLRPLKWTARTYLAIVSAVLVALGAGTAAAFLFPRGSDEACVESSNGQAVDCATARAVSGQGRPADQANAARADHGAQRRARACKAQLGELLTSLENLDGRVTGGLQYATYSQQVQHVRTLYGRVGYKDLTFDCLTKVGLPAEAALNSYAEADSIWHGCETDPGCDTRRTEFQVRRRWRGASRSIRDAKRGLRGIARPSAA